MKYLLNAKSVYTRIDESQSLRETISTIGFPPGAHVFIFVSSLSVRVWQRHVRAFEREQTKLNPPYC